MPDPQRQPDPRPPDVHQPVPAAAPPPAEPPPIVGPLADFLDDKPEYRHHVCWSAEHANWAMPGWVANRFYQWQLRRVRSLSEPPVPDEGDPQAN